MPTFNEPVTLVDGSNRETIRLQARPAEVVVGGKNGGEIAVTNLDGVDTVRLVGQRDPVAAGSSATAAAPAGKKKKLIDPDQGVATGQDQPVLNVQPRGGAIEVCNAKGRATITLHGNDATISAGDIVLSGADAAEDFAIAPGSEGVLPGTVMVIDDAGALRESQAAYDRRVAGVISGAGNIRPGIVLGRNNSHSRQLPIALVGKVYCRADATAAPISVGDLLTTAETPGHAMKADDPGRSFGAVIGKALCPLLDGYGLIPILVALQ